MNREKFESPAEQYVADGRVNWWQGSWGKHEKTVLSRADARYMIFWRVSNVSGSRRCCFPTLDEAIRQAEEQREKLGCIPDCVIDRMDGNKVVHDFG
jgi:hypothetical protein